jgi:3-oxoacyl-[acyl-carrier-protein] synthase I
MNRVVVTGIGIYSCIGTNLNTVLQSLQSGKSGIGLDPERKVLGFRSSLTGVVEKPLLKGVIPRRLRIGLAAQGEYAYLSTVEALAGAKIDDEFLDSNEIGIIFGNDTSAQAVIDSIDLMREKKDTMLLGSAPVFQSMNSTVTMNLSCIFRLKGINFTLSAACASGSHAIGTGYFFIKHGLQTMVICGGAQEVNAYSMGSFDALSAFSIRESDPEKASRPFDRDRDGLVPSGGAATLVLESYDSAKKRGAPILAEIVGYGFSSNGEHISLPNIDGPFRAIKMALNESGLQSNEIDYINAHATSTPAGDNIEAQVINNLFAQTKPLVSSTKSMTGHECWMAGASEIVYSILMMNNSFVAPNINFENPDEDSAKLNIATKPIEININAFLSNSFGFGGTNSVIIAKKLTG